MCKFELPETEDSVNASLLWHWLWYGIRIEVVLLTKVYSLLYSHMYKIWITWNWASRCQRPRILREAISCSQCLPSAPTPRTRDSNMASRSRSRSRSPSRQGPGNRPHGPVIPIRGVQHNWTPDIRLSLRESRGPDRNRSRRCWQPLKEVQHKATIWHHPRWQQPRPGAFPQHSNRGG